MTETHATSHRAERSPAHGNVHHGRTRAAWTGVTIATVGFILGGAAMVMGPNWILFWVSVGILVISLIATVVMQKFGHGANG